MKVQQRAKNPENNSKDSTSRARIHFKWRFTGRGVRARKTWL